MIEVFGTVLSGVTIYVAGQAVLKLVIEPVHDLKKTISAISYSLIKRASVFANPGQNKPVVMDEASQELENLAFQIHSHLYLIPCYAVTACIFKLPPLTRILTASRALTGLSRELHINNEHSYTINATHLKTIYNSLHIYRMKP